ncbi:hypothetical protein DOTSEDRAFT_92395 [Dothistroma septosporum NZE10]|uniref:Uncharacterized protein n=1 Tax=Dothistroma septosporum (strain NZE10 / CBS 128990) TaxID=675120 RepID=N1PD10_DOTSN|nr:hypothetical protein DOTSEDRAFT_92395 [Dothistroma septosporum NZE10]
MPRLVQPPGGMPQAPENTTLVQIGFDYGLNYAFVVNTNNSAAQIFKYLPEGLANGLAISIDRVKMNALMPYDTTGTLNFITTLAQAYIPADLVDQLQLDLHNPGSSIYQNDDAAVQQLMSMINPTISILPGANMDGGNQNASPSYNPSGESTSSDPRGGGAPIGGDSGSSQKVKGTSVGIGVGAVAGAAVYAAAMFYVARRYRRKRSSHQRTSSVPTAIGEMSQRGSPALSGGGMGSYFMSGANGRGSASGSPSGSGRGNSYGSGGRGSRNSGGSGSGSGTNRSVREQGISAPVMAENSLGWN